MHCEKYLCENMLKTIFGVKDTLIIQKDFKDCDIHPHLWLQNVTSGFIKPIASYVLTNEEKERFFWIINHLKFPSHYISSLKKMIKDGDLRGMKSHDYHILM
jgi:hypothetical protein